MLLQHDVWPALQVLIVSVPSFLNIGGLIFVVFFAYAYLGVQVGMGHAFDCTPALMLQMGPAKGFLVNLIAALSDWPLWTLCVLCMLCSEPYSRLDALYTLTGLRSKCGAVRGCAQTIWLCHTSNAPVNMVALPSYTCSHAPISPCPRACSPHVHASAPPCACSHALMPPCPMQLFGHIQPGGSLNTHANFKTWPNAMLVLIRTATADNWWAASH